MPNIIPQHVLNIGEIKKGIGDFKGAISAYQNVLALDPKQESTYLKLASCCFEVGTYNSMETALNALAECTSRFPRNQAAFMNLGIGYLKIEAKDEARSAFLSAKRLGNTDAGRFIRDFCS